MRKSILHVLGIWVGLSLLALGAFWSGSCQKKTSKVDVSQSECKNFKLSDPTYQVLADPTCTGSPLTASLRVTVKFSGKVECIDKIVVEPKFYDMNNALISNVTYPASYLKSDPLVSIGSNTITFTFNYTFANSTDANNLNNTYLKIYTLTEQEDKSNTVQVRANGACSGPGTYNTVTTVNVSSSLVAVRLWDDASEDGDIVSVYLNGVWVLENHYLTNAGSTFYWNVNPGSNQLIFTAVNQGSVGPNTLAVSINGGTKISISPDLSTGESINIQF